MLSTKYHSAFQRLPNFTLVWLLAFPINMFPYANGQSRSTLDRFEAIFFAAFVSFQCPDMLIANVRVRASG